MAAYQTDTTSSRRLRENIERRENERLSRSIAHPSYTILYASDPPLYTVPDK